MNLLHRLVVTFAAALVLMPLGTLPAAIPAAAAPAPAASLPAVGQIGGLAHAVAVRGTLAYLGVGTRLLILDVSRPDRPVLRGQSAPLPDVIDGIALAGSFAYLADGKGGLRVLDVANPAAPAEIGSLAKADQRASGVAVAGGYAFVAFYPAGLSVVDVSAPARPREAAFYQTPGFAMAVAVQGAHAFLTYARSYPTPGALAVLDVAAPASPRVVGLFPTASAVGAVVVAGDDAYVTDGKVHVVDVRDPARPTEVGTYTPLEFAMGLAVDGRRLYASDRGHGLAIVDVADPAHPTEVGRYDAVPSVYSLAAAGGHAYLAAATDGLRVVGVGDPGHPAEVGAYAIPAPGSVHQVAVRGSLAYIADDRAGLRVVDLSDRAAPREIGVYRPAGSAVGVDVGGHYAYVAVAPSQPGAAAGLRIVDVADPSRPVAVGFLRTPGLPVAVAVRGGYAFLADGASGVRIIDVADPAHPTEVAADAAPGYTASIALSGTRAYVAARDGGLRILDVSDPRRPVDVGVYGSAASDVAVDENRAYLAAGAEGLVILDVTDPAHPARLGAYQLPPGASFSPSPDAARHVAAAGDHVYVVGLASGLHVLDVGDPARPSEVASYAGSIGGSSIVVAGPWAYLGDVEAGLRIMALQGLPPASVPVDPARCFAQTGFCVADDTIWNYFQHRGGVPTFGYPTSRTFTLQGFTVQFFQRKIVQLDNAGKARLLNLLDSRLMPYARFNGSTFPGVDSGLVATAPAPTNQPATLAWVQQHAPNTVNGAPTNYEATFRNTVTAAVAFPNGADASLLPGFDLELWGVPTSNATVDPNNRTFIYLRWQRGIMHYDATCNRTQGILLGDYFKAILTGQDLPADVAQESANSPFRDQYNPSQPNWVHNPSLLPNTNLTNAFTPE